MSPQLERQRSPTVRFSDQAVFIPDDGIISESFSDADESSSPSSSWTLGGQRQYLAIALMRDKTLLQTESAAWSYAHAYDAAHLQFVQYHNESEKSQHHHGQRRGAAAAAAIVEPGLQRTLIFGMFKDYLTLERYSADSRARREQASQTRQSILEQYQEQVRHRQNTASSEDDDWNELGAYCESVNRTSAQWAQFMGQLHYAASKIDVQAVASAASKMRQTVPVDAPVNEAATAAAAAAAVVEPIAPYSPTNRNVVKAKRRRLLRLTIPRSIRVAA